MVGKEGVSGLCSVFGSQPNTHQALVMVGGQARRIKTAVLRQEFRRVGKLQSLLLDYSNRHLMQVSQKVVCESFHPIEKWLCSWLLMLEDRIRKNQFAITHEQLSLFLGVYRPTLSTIAKNLRDKGLISYVRGKFFILNRPGLQSIACECYEAVKSSG